MRDEIKELVAGSFLEDAPVLNVSAREGSGLEALRAALRESALDVPRRSSEFVARLPVDRAFSMKGFGAVVTGTLVSGEIKEGDELELLPNHLRVRTRGIQVHGRAVPRALAGQRTAVNLGGIDTAAVERGMVLAPVGRLQPVQAIDVELEVLRHAARPLRSRARVRVHLGTAEVLGRLMVLDESGAVDQGKKGFAQLRFESPVVALPDERFIIRSYSPSLTVAGGRVLDPFAHRHRQRDLAGVRERLLQLLEGDPAQRLAIFVSSAGDTGRSLTDVAAHTGWSDATLTQAATEAKARGEVVEASGLLLATGNFEQLCAAALAAVIEHHKREPLLRGLARETLRERHFSHAPPEIFRAAISHLEEQGRLISEKDLVRAREHSLELSATDTQLKDRLAKVYEDAALEAPSLDEAMARAGVPAAQRTHARKIFQLLIDAGVVIRVQGDLLFHREALNSLLNKVQDYAAAHEPERTIDVPAFKDLAGVSRKYAIPLLEYLDSTRTTIRQGDRRVIARRKE